MLWKFCRKSRLLDFSDVAGKGYLIDIGYYQPKQNLGIRNGILTDWKYQTEEEVMVAFLKENGSL